MKRLILVTVMLFVFNTANGVTIARLQYDGGDWYCENG